MANICKVYLKTVEKSDWAILCDYYCKWIHIKCNNLDKIDYEIKSKEDPWLSISCILNILPFCNKHVKPKETFTAPKTLFHNNKLFLLIENLNNLTDESSNDDPNYLLVRNKYRDPDYFYYLQSNIKSTFLNIRVFFIKKL